MHILVVEDNPDFSRVLVKLLQRIREVFPGSAIEVVNTLDAAVQRMEQQPDPNFVMLDLVLPPARMEDTIAKLHHFEDKSPVVIITGHQPEAARNLMGDRATGTEVLYKPDLIERGAGYLFSAMKRVATAFHGRRYAEQQERIRKLDQLIGNPTNDTKP